MRGRGYGDGPAALHPEKGQLLLAVMAHPKCNREMPEYEKRSLHPH